MPSPARNSAHLVPPNRECIQFDRFDLDLRSGELRKSGHRIRLQAQPFQLLALLLKHPGEVVTRDEIRRTLWETDTFVDFDHSLAAAVNKIRGALGDSAESPRFVETLPKRGYRFIGEVRRQPAPLAVAKPSADPEGAAISQATWHSGWPTGRLRTATWILLGVAGTLVLVLGWLRLRSRPESAVLTAVPFTSYPGTETAPALSPDGSRIAFSWDGGDESKSSTNGFDLYVKAIGSETLLRLTNHPSEWISSAWSPDGTQIAFHRLAGADTGVYVVPALGGPERKLRSTHVPYGVATQISWSPDGKWITHGDPLPGEAKDRVFLLSVDTLESRAFPHDPKCLHEANLIFSHSGKELAYLCVRSTRDFELYSRAVPNGSPRLAAAFPNFFNGYTWSGDDRKLIFSQQLDTGGELDEVTLRDGSLRKLGFGANASWPVVSSNGNKLAFSASTDQVNIWRKDLTRF